MDQTYPYGFPYPQCNPPLTEDAADIAHLRDLALAVDGAVGELATRADDLLISPDAGIMYSTVTQVANSIDNGIAFTTQEVDNSASGDLVQLAQNRFVIQQTGIYYITCGVRITSPSASIRPAVAFDVNGLVSAPYGQTIASATIEGALGVFTVRPLSVGDMVRFRWIETTNFNVNLIGARAGIFRMA